MMQLKIIRKLSEARWKGYAFKIYGNEWQHEIKPNTTCNSQETILLVKKENKSWYLDRKYVFIAQSVMILQDMEDHECQQ